MLSARIAASGGRSDSAAEENAARGAQLPGRPGVAVQAGGDRQRLRHARVGDAQPLPPVRAQRAHEDGLAGDRQRVGGREATAAGRVADERQVGGLEAGAVMVLAVDKRLQQQRFEAVALAEVGGQALQAQGDGLGTEVAAGRRR